MDETLGSVSIPPRVAVCVVCRTALLDGERCDLGDEHPIAGVDDPDGRERLVSAVWGTAEERMARYRRAVQIQRSLALTSIVGAGAGILLTSMVLPVFGAIHILGAVAAGGLLWSGGRRLLSPDDRAYPRGAAELVYGSRTRSRGARGEVAGDPDLVAPATAAECVAYAVELHLDGYWGDRIMFRDAVTVGFDVALDDRRVARVPAGRIRIIGPMRQEIDVDNVRMDEYMDAFDPERLRQPAFDPVRYNAVFQQVLVPGDRVELASAFEPVVDQAAPATHYRESVATILSPRGVPILRLLTPNA